MNFRVPLSANGGRNHRWQPVESIRDRNGVALHRSTHKGDHDDRFSVSHIKTGFGLFDQQTLSAAQHFYENVCRWPEWIHVNEKVDAQFLKGRVEEARHEALRSERP